MYVHYIPRRRHRKVQETNIGRDHETAPSRRDADQHFIGDRDPMTTFLAVVVGCCIGLCLGALGGGGSIVTVPALVYLMHQPVPSAVTDSLVIVAITSAVAMIAHAREGHVRWVIGVGLGAVGGSVASVGAIAARHVPDSVTMASFAVLMVAVAISLVIRSTNVAQKRPATEPRLVMAGADSPRIELDDPDVPHQRRRIPSVLLGSVLIGVLTGFFGVGGGFVIVPVLVLLLGYSMPIAVGTSLLVISINSAVALSTRAIGGGMDWGIIAAVAIAAIFGSLLGKRATTRLSEAVLTRAFAITLLIIAAYVAAHSLGIFKP